MRRPHLFVFAAAVFVACGGDLNHSAVIDTQAGDVIQGGTAAAGATLALSATLSEWRVQSPEDTVVPGPYQLLVTNIGRFTHALEIEGNEVEVKTERIAPGGRAQMSVDLKPGAYELYCPIQDSLGVHKDRGMTRMLVVRAP